MVEYTEKPGEDLCVIGGPAMMMRKDQLELRTWWDAAFERLIATSQYNDICDNVEEKHGEFSSTINLYAVIFRKRK